jgi:predicted O-methyltransferase YrrM/predicted Ser/Thr protein kinase
LNLEPAVLTWFAVSLENSVVAQAAVELGLVSKFDMLNLERYAGTADDGRRAPSLIGVLLEKRLITAQDVMRIVEKAREIGSANTPSLAVSPEVRPLLANVPGEVRDIISEPDRYLGNRYILIKQLGEGYYGEVWKAWDALLARTVAVKFTFKRGAEELKRFQQEALLAAKLNHPNIASVYEAGHFGNTWFISMEFVDGTPLDRLVNGGKLSLNQKMHYLRDAAMAIDYAHKNHVVHRDITPWNIMVDASDRVYVLDFGLAKSLDVRVNLTKVGESLGAIYFISPEQARGDEDSADPRSDIYMLGATLYFVLTGNFPFDGLDKETVKAQVLQGKLVLPSRRVPQAKLPTELDWIILKCMKAHREERFQTAAELADALDQVRRKYEFQFGDAPPIVNPEIEDYLSQLVLYQDETLTQMEELAAKKDFPIVGPLVGRLLFLLARVSGAKRVLELGSGFGYSAYWFLRAMPEDGRLVFIDRSKENAEIARALFEKMGCADRVDFHVGDALEILNTLEGPFDVIFNDIDKQQYPTAFLRSIFKLRQGGLLISDNVLWKGSVLKEPSDAASRGIQEYNRLAHQTVGVFSTVIPVRDGVGITYRM